MKLIGKGGKYNKNEKKINLMAIWDEEVQEGGL